MDKAAALNWYRQAWGLAENQLVYRSDAEQALLAKAEENVALQAENVTLAEQMAQARSEREKARAEAAARAAVSSPAPAPAPAPVAQAEPLVGGGLVSIGASTAQPGADVSKDGRNYGRYYALVIGNGSYQFLDDLQTPASDVDKIARVLSDKYGFAVQVLKNTSDVGVLRASGRDALLSDAYIGLRFPNKSRLLLTSGQDFPLVSERDPGTSVFAEAFLRALQDNEAVITAPALFLSMLDLLDLLDKGLPGLDPEFKAIKRAGDAPGNS